MKLELDKEYFCAWHGIGKTKIVELWEHSPDCLIEDRRCGADVAVGKCSLFEEENGDFAMEQLAFKLNRREATGHDLVALIAQTIKMMAK